MATQKKTVTKPKKKTLKTNIAKIKSNELFDATIEKYRDNAYKSSGGWEEFTVGLKLRILREVCESNNLSWECKIIDNDITDLYHMVHVEVSVKYPNGRTLVTHGLSTQYVFDFVAMAKGTCSERAQTVALGKALSMLGIALHNNLYSSEEMLTFQAMKDVDLKENLNSLAKRIDALDDITTTKIRNSGKRIRDFLKIYDEMDSIDEFKNKVENYLNAESRN